MKKLFEMISEKFGKKEEEIEEKVVVEPLKVYKEQTRSGEISSDRVRDFKGSLVQWLAKNGPASKLIPATYDLCGALSEGISLPYWHKKIRFDSKGVSFKHFGKKKFFRWDQLVFQVKYSLYDTRTLTIVSEKTQSSLRFRPETIYFLAKDGTEIGWIGDKDAQILGNFEIDLKLPEQVISKAEDYTFEYQDGVSGYYFQEIPVWYFASDLSSSK